MVAETSFLDLAQKKYSFKDDVKPIKKIEKKGMEETVREISKIKKEPKWMLNLRLKALKIFRAKKMPDWGADLSEINFDDFTYYSTLTKKPTKNWEEVPEKIKNTFERLGIPEAERKFLAGVGVMYESETVYHKLREEFEKQGVVFIDMDSAVKKHPELVKKYFGTVVPAGDNKFAALNTAFWSGGSFIYIPKGVKVGKPLQAYFRINQKNMGQFERTLIIVDEGAEAHYIEGCFKKGTMISTNPEYKPIEEIKIGDKVLTHMGEYKRVYHTQKRKHTGDLYTIEYFGDSTTKAIVTDKHPFLFVKRERKNEQNRNWQLKWGVPPNLERLDYLVTPINRVIKENKKVEFKIKEWNKNKRVFKDKKISVFSTPEFFKLVGYYLAEGSISGGYYLNFSFGSHETEYIEDVENLLKKLFKVKKVHKAEHKKNNGTSLVVSSVKLARIFEHFGKGSANKRIPHWMLLETPKKQKELIKGYFYGDGNYYNKKHKAGLKEAFRMNTTSYNLAKQVRDILLRLGVVAFLNKRNRKHENRQTMYTIGITGRFMSKFGKIVNIPVKSTLNNKIRASLFYIDENYAYYPIKSIKKKKVKNYPVYNFGVENDESYVAEGVAVHNCSAPSYSTDSLHAAVVEVIAHKNSRVRYTTLQNWSSNVYNLVTKRAFAYENSYVEWVDANVGAKKTMKYPSVYLKGKHANANILTVAFANKGQEQDTGAKAVHLAPNTTSTIISKSVSKNGGANTYRGLLKVAKNAKNCKGRMQCDALILDEQSKADAIPSLDVNENNVEMSHEATVGKISKDSLFYLMSRGLTEQQASTMIISGFFEEFTKTLPLEYAVEFKKLIDLEMEGSVG